MDRQQFEQEYNDLKTLITNLESKSYTIQQMCDRIGFQKYIIDDLMRKKPRATNNYIPVIQRLQTLYSNPDIEFTTEKYLSIQERLNNIEKQNVIIQQKLNDILQKMN